MKSRTPKHTKGPPRYVPTLTEVVSEELVAAAALSSSDGIGAGAEMKAPPVPAMSEKAVLSDPAAADFPLENPLPVMKQKSEEEPGSVPADMPLTGQATLAAKPAQVVQATAVPSVPAGGHKNGLPDVLEEALVHRVMQRVDLALDQRVRDAIATVVQEQTRSLLPRLCEELESIVRQVVSEAVADEVAIDTVRRLQRR